MELGEKIRQERLAAGLSQRQLCGDRITRNMLSQIENGSAMPSMSTLRYLAERLGKSVSCFLEETAVTSPNPELMMRLRQSCLSGSIREAVTLLKEYRGPDPLFDAEFRLIERLCLLEEARTALDSGRELYAADLLTSLGSFCQGYCADELERRRLLLLGRAQGVRKAEICAQLPSLDGELLLRAEAALESGDASRCVRLLDAAQDSETPRWNLLRGEAYLARQEYTAALECLRRAEAAFPDRSLPQLERCCRELGDFRGAYEYACKQRF